VGENLRVRPTNRLAVRATPVDLPELPLVRSAALMADGNFQCLKVVDPATNVPVLTALMATGLQVIVHNATLATSPLGATAARNPTATALKNLLDPATNVPVLTALLVTAPQAVVHSATLATSPLGATVARNPTATALKNLLDPATNVPVLTALMVTAPQAIVHSATLATSPLGATAARNPTATALKNLLDLDLNAGSGEIESTGRRSKHNAESLDTKPPRNLLPLRTKCA
jgi:hypothetical protein